MAMKGTIFVFHNPANRQLEVHAVNHAESPGELTHNILPTRELAYNRAGRDQHDDNGQFGHGNPVPRGTDAAPGRTTLNFPIGGTYNTEGDFGDGNYRSKPVPIEPGAYLRVGFRDRAFRVVEIPKPGKVVEVPYEKMLSQERYKKEGSGDNWRPTKMVRRGRHVPPALKALFSQKSPHVVAGQVRIVPVEEHGTLVGWDVWFENRAHGRPKRGQTQGFTGTVVLTDRRGQAAKNAGLGLESMPCPGPDTGARQRIVAGGDYGMGITADEGTPVRLGIRGHSSHTTQLPGRWDDEVVINLAEFELGAGQSQSDWFDGKKLAKKLGEKKNRVDFFEGKKRINANLPDTIYAGAEAFIRAEFKQPPHVLVEREAPSKEHRAGGWRVRVESLLPDEDKIGPLGFTCRPRIEVNGELYGARFLAGRRMVPGDKQGEWFIPADASLGGQRIRKGSTLVIDTGPLGWRASIALPGVGESFDSQESKRTLQETWTLRESDYYRAGLVAGEPD